MNRYCTLFVILLIQLSLKYVAAQIVDEKTVCKNGVLIQLSNSFECLCDEGYVQIKEDECFKKEDLVKECKADTEGKPCGMMANCVKETRKAGDVTCECQENYYDTGASGISYPMCLPIACDSTDCEKGFCRINSKNEAICSCILGHGNEDESDISTRCSKKVDKPECKLPCPDNAECVTHVDGFYHCLCKNNAKLVDGKCSNAVTLFLSPLNVFFAIAVYIISLKSA